MFIDTLSLTGQYLITDRKLSSCGDYYSIDEVRAYYKKTGQPLEYLKRGLTHEENLESLLNPIFGFELFQTTPINMYEKSYAIKVDHLMYSDKPLGHVAHGGNNDTWQIYLNGHGMRYINNEVGIQSLYDLSLNLNMEIKRVDIAIDDFAGDFDLNEIMEMYKNDEYNVRKKPKITMVGDFISQDPSDGRTIYIGSRQSARYIRHYEKGKQLGDPNSPWIRHELELKAVDFRIPRDCLLQPENYYSNNSAMNLIKAVLERKYGNNKISYEKKVLLANHERLENYVSTNLKGVLSYIHYMGLMDSYIDSGILNEEEAKKYATKFN